MNGMRNLNNMPTKKFLLVLTVSLFFYLILDYVFDHALLYIVGGIVGGSISEVFKFLGLEIGFLPICLIWTALLVGVVVLFYHVGNKHFKYIAVIVIAALLYIIDTIVAGLPYSDSIDTENITIINNIVIGGLVLSKSLILSLIIYFEKVWE